MAAGAWGSCTAKAGQIEGLVIGIKQLDDGSVEVQWHIEA
jgi:hypothetical protein